MTTPKITRLPRVPSLSWDDCRLLVESIVDYAIFMLDTDGRVATWNSGAERIKGYRADEILGEHFSRFYTEEDVRAGKPRRLLEIAAEAGHVDDVGWRVRKDGSRFWASVVLTAVRDEAQNLRGFGKVTRDLTTQREAEERERQLLREQTAREVAEASALRVRESEARYRALSARLEIILEGVADGITVQDQTGRVIFANSAAARFCGFDSGAELVAADPADVVARFEIRDEDGQPFPVGSLPGQRVLNGETESRALVHVRESRNRRDWWALIRATSVPSADGTHTLAVNIWHDVTAERREESQTRYLADATAALGSSLMLEKTLEALAGALVPGLGEWCTIYLLEADKLKDVAFFHADSAKRAEAAEYRRRFPPDPARTQGLWKVVRHGTTEVMNDITDELLSRSLTDDDALALLKKLAVRAVIFAPIRVREQVLGVIALGRGEEGRPYDPGDRELVEEIGRRAGAAVENVHLYAAARDAVREAERASQAKDQFLAVVSHELRTPLSAILGWSELLKGRVTDTTLAKPIDVIHRNAVAQVKIIDDILDVSRVITGKFRLEPKPADLVAIAKEAAEVVRPSAVAKQIEIRFTARPEFCLLVADPERLQQVIWNLLSNAVKFTDAGGRIEIAVHQDRSSVLLSVKDTGKGLDPEFLPYVFDRFRQADSSTTRRVGGLGLGLALVRHIVELHGGQVAAHSEGIGKGATFSIAIPIRAVLHTASTFPAEGTGAETASRPPTTLDDVRVLVVDDEADARDLVTTVLREAGAIVETAGSAAEAFAAFRCFQPGVLVSDVGMPGEDGLSLMRRIRELSASDGGQVPSLALTAFAREEDRSRAIGSGYTTHIGKPVNSSVLVSAVANLAAVGRGA